MRRMAILLAALLLLALVPPGSHAAGEGTAAGWRVAVTLDTATLRPDKMFEAFDTASLNLYDFDEDGRLEIVTHNDNNHAYVIDPDPDSPRILAEIVTTHPGGEKWPIRELNPIAVGDLYGDGVPCMVIPNSAAYMSAWCYDAAASTSTKFNFTKKWEVKVDASKYEEGFKESHPWLYEEDGSLRRQYSLGLDGNAYLADVDGDGPMEVFVETDGFPGQLAFNHDGTYRWSKSFADGNAGAKVLDVDKDGKKEAVFFSDSGLVVAYTGATGTIEWTFDPSEYGAWPGSTPVPGLVADLHGDGYYETVFGTRNVVRDMSDPDWINESHAMYFALNHKGQMLWNATFDWGNPLVYNHPAPVDANGDGVLDIAFLDWNTIGHKPGDWNTTSRQSNLFILDGKDGSAIWHKGITVYWSNKDFVIAKVEGQQSVIAPTARGGSDGLGVYSLKDGERTGWFPLEWQLSRGPVAGNLYGDGKTHLVVPLSKSIRDRPNYRDLDVGYREGKLVVVATDQPYDVTFSANILNSDDQRERQVQGSAGTTPTPKVTTTPPTNPPTQPIDNENETPPLVRVPPPMPVDETNETNVTTTTTTTTRSTTTTTPEESTDPDAPVPAPGVALLVAAVAAMAVLRRR